MQGSLFQTGIHIRKRIMAALIPDQNFAGSVMSLCNNPFKTALLKGVVLHLHGKPFFNQGHH
ncbi:MAG: hypothetical protein KKD01_15420 [Proteobacteria bacterium]|nr:hypothetical protein [Pseudomonadota bacterium]MBU1420550.1 hypothetical protein [Pseudomonadota bacterium]MBU1456113.1 hypothetical protein [Pseudomonadota bacterium]